MADKIPGFLIFTSSSASFTFTGSPTLTGTSAVGSFPQLLKMVIVSLLSELSHILLPTFLNSFTYSASASLPFESLVWVWVIQIKLGFFVGAHYGTLSLTSVSAWNTLLLAFSIAYISLGMKSIKIGTTELLSLHLCLSISTGPSTGQLITECLYTISVCGSLSDFFLNLSDIMYMLVCYYVNANADGNWVQHIELLIVGIFF